MYFISREKRGKTLVIILSTFKRRGEKMAVHIDAQVLLHLLSGKHYKFVTLVIVLTSVKERDEKRREETFCGDSTGTKQSQFHICL